MARASKPPAVQAVVIPEGFEAIEGATYQLADGRHATATKIIEPLPIQIEALRRKEFEVLFGGSKGGSKTACGRFWLLGLTDDPQRFYIHDKRYRALVLRRNQIDLGRWVDEAQELFGLWGAEYKDRPYPCFVFPSGAKFVLGHLADEDAYEKWQGQEFHRMLIEELTQIPTFRLYWLTVGNCRSPYKELRPQVFLTTNPIGPGTGWVRERFIDVLDKHGKPVAPKQTIEEEFKMPDGRVIVRTRVYIPARLTDNKYLMDDPGYMAQLMGLPPNERKAMLDGDWHAMSGVFFCADEKTEILSDKGFVSMLGVQKGDPVATLSPAGEMTFEPCSQATSFDYTGWMIQGKSATMDFKVTPNHQMYCEKDNGKGWKGNFSFVSADALPRRSVHPIAPKLWQGEEREFIELRYTSPRNHKGVQRVCPECDKVYETKLHRLRHRKETTCSRECSYKFRAKTYGRKLDNDFKSLYGDQIADPQETVCRFPAYDFMEMLGWFIAEGSMGYQYYKGKRSSKHAEISQSESANPARVARIAEILNRLNLKFDYNGKKFRIRNVVLAEYLSKLGYSHEKYIPHDLLNLSRRHLKRLFTGLVLGDGCPTPNGEWHYYSVSKRLANDFQELCLRLRLKCSIQIRRQPTGREFGYMMFVSQKDGNGAVGVEKSNVSKVWYEGKVGCVTVEPHHTILLRRNNKLIWTGNSTFRPQGPLTGEPLEANHIVDSATTILKPWWHRWAALDWGFSHNTVIQWACHEPDSRVYVTREMVTNKTSPEEVGAEFARRSIDDLRGLPRKSMALWLPHDAFGQRTEEKTIADQIRIGIEKTLGPNSCYIADASVTPPGGGLLDQIDATREMSIVLRRTVPNRVAGWQFINQMLRWWPIHPTTTIEFDRDYALRLLYDSIDPDAYARYMASLKSVNAPKEVLPMLRIFASCPMTIKALQSVVHDPKKPEDILKVEGDDAVDCLSYLCGAFRHELNREPFESFLEKRLAAVQARSPLPLNGASEFWIAQKAESDWKGAQVPPSACVTRSSMGRRQNVNTIP